MYLFACLQNVKVVFVALFLDVVRIFGEKLCFYVPFSFIDPDFMSCVLKKSSLLFKILCLVRLWYYICIEV